MPDAKKDPRPELGDVRDAIAEDLAARIRSGGNITEQLERWAHAQDPEIAAKREYEAEKKRQAAAAAAEERAAFEEFKKQRAAKKGGK